MALTKVWIEEGCISCGLCESTCPEVFTMPDLAQVKPGADFGAYEETIRQAAAACPVEVIKFS